MSTESKCLPSGVGNAIEGSLAGGLLEDDDGVTEERDVEGSLVGEYGCCAAWLIAL